MMKNIHAQKMCEQRNIVLSKKRRSEIARQGGIRRSELIKKYGYGYWRDKKKMIQIKDCERAFKFNK